MNVLTPRLDEFLNYVAGLWFAGDSCVLQILPDLYRDAIQVAPNHAARNLRDALGCQLDEIMMVGGQSAEAGLGNALRPLLLSGN